ncbi:MAG: M48 family metallopeptidase [Methylococcales bacterium]|nr:M48 family metallopeptidase [Methylococcales bacterium]
MTDIQIFLFGADLPVAGQRAQCMANQEGIHLQFAQFAAPLFIHWRELHAKVAGFDHDQLQLTWQQEAAAWSLIPADATEQKKLIAVLPKESLAGFKHWQHETQSQSWLWKGILYATAFVGLAVLLLVWQHDRAAMWAASMVSMKTEKSLGESVLKSLNPKANFLSEGEAVKTVQRIGQQLTVGSRYHYQWYVSKDPAVNAFALPGGIIVVNSGLLKHADTPNELAAVLAHEVQHVEQRHALQNMMNSAAMATVVLVVLGDANAVVMMVAHQLSSQYFSRQVESDADLKGVQLLNDKHIDTRGMVSFFKKLEAGFDQPKEPKASKEASSEVSSWLSSHPDTLARIATIESYIAQHPCQQCTVLTWNKADILAELERSEKK